jgi:anthranilate phosphoribosyltransferase
VADLRGGDAAANAGVVREILNGKRGPVRDAVLLNAAAGLVSYDLEAEGTLTERMSAAFARAAESVDSGKAAGVLSMWTELSRSDL